MPTQTQLAIITGAGSTAIASLGWQSLFPSSCIAPLCHSAVGLIEEALRRQRGNESYCDCAAEARVSEQVEEAFRRHRAPEVPAVFEGPVRGVIYELASSGPWLLEVAVVAAAGLLLAARSCAGLAVRVLAPAPAHREYRAVHRRLR